MLCRVVGMLTTQGSSAAPQWWVHVLGGAVHRRRRSFNATAPNPKASTQGLCWQQQRGCVTVRAAVCSEQSNRERPVLQVLPHGRWPAPDVQHLRTRHARVYPKRVSHEKHRGLKNTRHQTGMHAHKSSRRIQQCAGGRDCMQPVSQPAQPTDAQPCNS